MLPAGTLDPALFPDPPFRSRRRCSQTKVGRQPNSEGRAPIPLSALLQLLDREAEKNAHDRQN